jgi:MoxR-like ATPase
VERRQWLVIDELNRADVDRAFGELMTVLAGRSTETTLVMDDKRLVKIGNDEDCSHRIFGSFRVIATMNTWDKTSLFRLSHAVQRRFALIYVDVPDDATYANLLDRTATTAAMDLPLDARTVSELQRLFSSKGILAHRAIGPAVALDIVRYMRRRQASGDGLAEALQILLFPQLEALDQSPAVAVLEILKASLQEWTSPAAIGELHRRYQEIFPHLRLNE